MNSTTQLNDGLPDNLPIKYRFSKLIRIWPWLHGFSLLALILQPTTPAVILGRYSRNSMIIGVIALALLPITIFISHWFGNQVDKETFHLTQKQYIFIIVVCGTLLLPVGAIASLPTNSYIFFAFYGAYVLCITAIWSLTNLLAQGLIDLRSLDKHAWAICICVCFLLLLLAAYFPGQFWTDEGYNTSLALSINRDSQFAVPIFRLTPQIYGPNYSLVYIALGVVYQIFGVHLAFGRMLIFAIGLLSLFFIGRACLLYYSASTTRVVVIVSGFVLLGVNYLRADVEVAMWLSVALWAYALAFQNKKRWWHIAVGFAVGFSLDGHPNAYRLAMAFAISYTIDFAFESYTRRSLIFVHPLSFLLGGLFIGAVTYTILYSLAAPDAFSSRIQSFQLILNFPQLFTQISEQLSSAIRNGALLFGTTVLGLAISLRRGNALDRLLGIVLVISSVVLGLIYGYYRDYYFVHLLPIYILFAVAALDYLKCHLPPYFSTSLMNALLLLIMLPSVSWLSAKIIMGRSQDYSQAQIIADQIKAFVPTQDVFIGADPLVLKMIDYPNFVEFNTGLAMALHDKINEKIAWKRINPSAVAILRDYPIPPPQSLIVYIKDEQFTLVHCWNADQIGRVDLYMKILPVGIISNPTCDTVHSKQSVLNPLW